MMEKSPQEIWIGLEDLNNDPEFKKNLVKDEFFELPVVDALSDQEKVETATTGASRRDFLKYLGFGLGAATIAASCEIPIKKGVPYVVKPDTIVPGVATYYASTFVKGGDVCPIVVKTRDQALGLAKILSNEKQASSMAGGVGVSFNPSIQSRRNWNETDPVVTVKVGLQKFVVKFGKVRKFINKHLYLS